jgi:hypothetical protein
MNTFALGDMPLGAPPWFFFIFQFLIFWLHVMSVWLLIGGLILGVTYLVKEKADWKNSKALAYMPILMAMVINLGVPPLLFIQVLYPPFFFSSSILLAVPWISVFFLLVAGYGAVYAARYFSSKAGHAIALLSIAGFIVLVISFIYSNNMSLMIKPEFWQKLYSTKQNGVNIYPNLPEVISRWLWVISPAFAGGALLIGKSKKWAIASAVISIAALISYKTFWTAAVSSNQLVHFSMIADFVLAGLLLVLSFIPTSSVTQSRIVLGAWISLKAISVIALRHGIRSASLDPVYPLNNLPVHITPYLIAFFLAVIVIGFSTVAWMYINGRKGLTI